MSPHLVLAALLQEEQEGGSWRAGERDRLTPEVSKLLSRTLSPGSLDDAATAVDAPPDGRAGLLLSAGVEATQPMTGAPRSAMQQSGQQRRSEG